MSLKCFCCTVFAFGLLYGSLSYYKSSLKIVFSVSEEQYSVSGTASIWCRIPY